MDNNEINNIFLKLQDLYYKKSSEETINEYLSKKNISIDLLVQKFESLEIKDEYKLENILKIIEILITYPSFKINLFNSILANQDKLINIKVTQISKFILNFLRYNPNFYENDKLFINKIINSYIFDESAGIYEQARDLMIFIINSNKFEDNFINIMIFFEKFQMKSKDTILLVRAIEIVILLMGSGDKNINEYTKNLLFSFIKDFYNFDILTQLTILDLFEQSVNNKVLAKYILDDLNIFENIKKNEIYPEIFRKSLFCLTKFYAKNLYYDKNEIIKTIKASFGYFDENTDYNFIFAIFQNLFYNEGFYTLLLNDFKEEFLETITMSIVEAYSKNDPGLKSFALELFVLLFDFKIPSIQHENYLKYFLNTFYNRFTNKYSIEENEVNELFVFILNKDFKTFDYEEYELLFLHLIKSMLTYEPMFKRIVNFLDLDIYLLDRRSKIAAICELKYEIITIIVKSSNEIEKTLLAQFNKYLNKGIY